VNILILNGPNLNFTGQREVDVYGQESFEQILVELQKHFPGYSFELFQSNHEGELIDKLHKFIIYDGIVINAGALSHYSYALYDALRFVTVPTVEVHLSNVFKREAFRHQSVISPACDGVIAGFGKWSYFLAVEWIKINA
jgi:3-dehydroquinate dehydratase-2